MNWFRNIKLLTKTQLFISFFFVVMFLFGGSVFYFLTKKRITTENQKNIENQLDELGGVIEIYLKRDYDILNLATGIADYKLTEYGDIVEKKDKKISIEAVDPYTKQTIEIEINEWLDEGFPLLNNYLIVDEIKKLTKLDVSVYQKTDKGYVNVSTSILSLAQERLTGDVILNSSPIVKTVENGKQYSGRVFQRNSWYLTNYKPIYIDGKVKGMYYIGIKERIGRALKDVFVKRKIYKSGYPFLISKEGELLIHPEKQGEDFSEISFFKKMIESKSLEGNIEYKWPENRTGKRWSIHYKYHPVTDSYICISYPRNELYRGLNNYIIYGILAFILFFILLQMIFYIAYRAVKRRLRRLRNALGQLSAGHNMHSLKLSGEKEFEELSDRINSISNRFNDIAKFADSLANDNFSQTYPKSFINTPIGEALIRINDKLNEAMYNENIRQKEEKLRVWESEGLSKFVNILQRNRENLEELCYELISSLVQYLNANVGALFFINADNPNDVYFEQMATYAFDQKKQIQKKIYPEQGLIGRIFNEKETIYLSEIPEEYVNITSGLGEGAPKNLLIVPLLINKEVYGAIEIASFNLIKGFQIEFIEKIGENIASTINNVLVNSKTKELLKQSREQSELLTSQEEEMRKNLMELQNIQKESGASQYVMKDLFKELENELLLVEINGKGDILSVNDRVPGFFSMTSSDLIGKHYSDYSNLVPVDEYKNLILGWEKLNNNEKVQTELKIKSGLGKMVNLLVLMIPKFENNELIKIVLVGIELK